MKTKAEIRFHDFKKTRKEYEFAPARHTAPARYALQHVRWEYCESRIPEIVTGDIKEGFTLTVTHKPDDSVEPYNLEYCSPYRSVTRVEDIETEKYLVTSSGGSAFEARRPVAVRRSVFGDTPGRNEHSCVRLTNAGTFSQMFKFYHKNGCSKSVAREKAIAYFRSYYDSAKETMELGGSVITVTASLNGVTLGSAQSFGYYRMTDVQSVVRDLVPGVIEEANRTLASLCESNAKKNRKHRAA